MHIALLKFLQHAVLVTLPSHPFPPAPMVERKKKNTLEKMIENLSKDEATLVQMLETSNALRKPHQVTVM